jgi:hypothetical protein
MSRSGYDDDYGADDPLALGRYRAMVKSASRGKRGQALFKDILIAMNGMPCKRLIAHDLEHNGAVCAIGAAGKLRGVDMSKIDPGDAETVAGKFNVADCLAREIVFENDENSGWEKETPEARFERMRKWVRSQIRDPLFDVVWC